MSVMSRFFLAGADQHHVDATGITDIELQALDEILTGAKDREVDAVDNDDADDDDDAVEDDDGDDDDGDDDDGDLVFVVPDDLVAALVEGDTTSLRLAAIRWAMIPELKDADADVLFDLVFDLATLSRRARSEGRALHLRVSG